MLIPLLHLAIGIAGAAAIDSLLRRVYRIEGHSLSIAPLIVGIGCASLAHFLSPWATPAVLVMYGLTAWNEQRGR